MSPTRAIPARHAHVRPRFALLLCATALALPLLATGASLADAATPTISEFSTGLNASSRPWAIVANPGGNLWFTDEGTTSAIGEIDPTTHAITEFTSGLNSGSFPDDMGTGPDGTPWFTDEGTTPAIGEIDPTTHAISEFSTGLNSGSAPSGIATGPDGNLWFADFGSTPAIGEIDPGTHAITEFSTGLNSGSSPLRIAAGPDGNLWFTDSGSTPAIGEINPTTHAITEFSTGLNPGSIPRGIVLGPDGNMWFTDFGSTPAIGEIDPTTHAISEFSTGLNSGSTPDQIALGADGNLWFADNSTTTPAIGEINPTTHAISELSVGSNPGNRPIWIVGGPDGNQWFTDFNAGAIGQITVPFTLSVTPAGTGSGGVTSAPAGISCPGTCSATYAQGTQVTLTATSSSGSTFSGWSGGGCSGSGTCTVTMSANRSVTATFTAAGAGGNADHSAPSVSIGSPVDGSRVLQGARVVAGYTCADPDGPGDVASCAGPVASGARVDTGTLGRHAFTVTARDRAGNQASRTVTYTVVADESANFRGCTSPRVLRSYTLQPRGGRVRIAFSGPRAARIAVDVFQHTRGRLAVLRAVRVAHFAPRRSFTWNGRPNLHGRRVADGIYSIRITARHAGKADARELTLIRVHGRFSSRVGFFRPASCDNLRLFTLERPAFGGPANTPLRIGYELRRATTVVIQVVHAGRLVATFTDGLRAAGRIWRHRVPARHRPAGDYKVFITIGTAPGALRTSLVARRL